MEQIYDVAVIGAGPSGVAAASYASKYGAKTILLEKNTTVGGTAFLANIQTLSGESFSDMDGLLDGITKKAWGSMIFQHEELVDRYYSLLQKYKVKTFLGYEVIAAQTSDDKITSVVCSSIEGKITVAAKTVIDATGILDIESLVGAKDSGIPSYCYMTGLVGKIESVGGKCYSADAKRLLKEKIAHSKQVGSLDHKIDISIQPTVRADIALLVLKYENSDKISGYTMRKKLNRAVEFMQDFGYGFENASLISSSKEIFYSALGSLNTEYTLSLEDIAQNKFFSDQVVTIPEKFGSQELVYIPYGALKSKNYANLLLCGRNIGANINALNVIDSIPVHFETGKAAGIAAAIAANNEIELSEVSSYEIVSKSQDTVKDKIEIINESLGIEGEDETESPFNILDSDESSYIFSASLEKSPPPKSTESTGAEYNSDEFSMLDKALSLISDEAAPEEPLAEESVIEIADEMPVSKEDDEVDSIFNIIGESLVKGEEDKVSEADELFEKMEGFSELIQKFPDEDLVEDEKEAEEAEPINEEKAFQDQDHSDDIINYDLFESITGFNNESSGMEEEEAFTLPEDEKPEDAPSEPILHETVAEEAEKTEFDYDTLLDITDQLESESEQELFNEKNISNEDITESSTDIDNNETLEKAPLTVEEFFIAKELEEEYEEETADILDEITDYALSEIESSDDDSNEFAKSLEQSKNIFSSNDVLSMLYDEDNANQPEVNKSTGNAGSIIQDDLSVLYNYDMSDENKAEADSLQETTPEPEIEDTDETEPAVKKIPKRTPPSQRKPKSQDKVSSMIDLIYDITDSKEISKDMEEEIAKGTTGKSEPAKNSYLNTEMNDKFKELKAFLYDNDND